MEREKAVAGWASVTFAPATTAEDWSVTVPERVAEATWAWAAATVRIRNKSADFMLGPIVIRRLRTVQRTARYW